MIMLARVIVFAAFLCTAASAAAAVISDNFGPGDAFNAASGANVSSFIAIGAPFVSLQDATATDIVVALSTTSASAVTATFSLVNDASGHPGSLITSATITVQPGGAAVYHATLSAPAALAQGTQYWITAGRSSISSGSFTWQYNSTGAMGSASTLPTGLWIVNATGVTPSLRVEDNSVPPPGACCTINTGACTSIVPSMCGAGSNFLGGSCTPNPCPPPPGVCCRGATCNQGITVAASCTVAAGANAGALFATPFTSCNSAGDSTTPCCAADYDKMNGVQVADIFAMLNDWFAELKYAIPGGDGVHGTLSVQNIFDFLNDWFAGGC
jgi:hypothetical protein